MNPVMFWVMEPGDAEAVSRLVIKVFDAAIAPLYETEGVEAFRAFASAQAIRERADAGHLFVIAVSGPEVVAVAEVRDKSHLAMFFVAENFQGSGLGREMLSRVVDTCTYAQPEIEAITVHASPNAIRIYERLGFEATGPEQTVNGIRFTPMVMHLESQEAFDTGELIEFDD